MTSFTKRISSMFAIGLCAVIVDGCGGGAVVGTSAMRPQSQSPVLTAQSTNGALSTKAANGNVTFAIRIKPKTKTGRTTPKYVSPSTQSLQILTDGANPVIVNLTPLSPNCVPDPMVPGAYICTASLNIPAGNHVFTVTTYDLPGATGNVLSTNSTDTVFVKPTGTTTVSIVLEGAVHYVVLILAANPPIGTATTIGLTVIPEDADKNFIVGPAAYEYPITLTTTDSTNGPLSKTTLNSPSDTSGILVDYNGANIASVAYSANATGLSAANVINAILTPGAITKPEHLYVANQGSNSVSVFDTAHDNTALPEITGGGLNYVEGVAIDANGKLYIVNVFGNSVSVFDTAHGNTALPTITGGGLNFPSGAAIDASGKLYVVNDSSNETSGSVSVFDTAHGNAVLPAITGGGMDFAQGATVDLNGKLYVANEGGQSVSVFDTAHGNAALPEITAGLTEPFGAAVDASHKLYVVNDGNPGSVSVFDTAHGNATLPTITGGGLNGASAVAIDASGKLYVTNYFGNSVSVFDTAHGNVALPAITGGGLSYPIGVAVR
jgi:YVTN family beta-propeller protein